MIASPHPLFDRLFVALRGVVYASLFVLLWAWVAASVRPLDDRLSFAIPPSLRTAGIAIALPGALLTAWCVLTFVTRGRGTPAPFDPPRRFVASGPYRYVRNPMYVGAVLVILGGGLIVASPAVALLSGLFWLLVHLVAVLYEEPSLESRFGDDYRRYRASVNRWLPRRPRSPR
jgi:protein-S-isoprenylcysteine O-methyltransferase Ste14